MKITLLTPALVAILGLALGGAPITAPAQMDTTTPAPAAPATTTTETPASSSMTTSTTSTTEATKPAKVKKTVYHGTLTAIDTTANTITVSTSKKDPTKLLTLSIASTAKILRDKKPATLADFAVGDKVGGSYTVDASGTKTALTINYHTPKPVTPPSATAPATMGAPTPGSESAPAAASPAPAPTPATPAGQ